MPRTVFVRESKHILKSKERIFYFVLYNHLPTRAPNTKSIHESIQASIAVSPSALIVDRKKNHLESPFSSTFAIFNFQGPTLGRVFGHVATCYVGVLHKYPLTADIISDLAKHICVSRAFI